MADEASPQQIRGINWRETFAFTHLFRSFGIAVHPSKLVLGLIALLALYVGGRLLDGVWPARHLAVPGEPYIYEQVVETGGRSEEFVARRRAGREAIEGAYADRLQSLGIVTDRTEAIRTASRGDRLGELKQKLIESRDRQVQAEKDRYGAAYRDADNIQNPEERERARRDAYERYQSQVRDIYTTTSLEWRQLGLVRGVGLFHSLFEYQAHCVNGVIRGVAGWNWLDERDGRPAVIPSVINFFRIGPVWLMRNHPVYFVLYTLWFLTVWAIFGGAIARIAAIHIARDEKLSVRAALAFSSGKFLSFVSAPLIPLVIVLFVGLIPLLAGAIASLPYVGPILNIAMAALFILLLACGFVMTLVLLGTFGGFNLMYPTIAVEGSDSFDAISRSFSYVYARPWRMLFYTVVAIIYGAITYLFVRLFIWLMLSLTHAFVGAGMWKRLENDAAPLWPTMWPGPQATGSLSYTIDHLALRTDQDITASLLAFWIYLVVAMLGAYVISFYFTVNTIMYYLMRNDVDATEMDDVYLEQSEEDFGDTTTPVATAPASAVVVETTRPTSPPADAPSTPEKTEPTG